MSIRRPPIHETRVYRCVNNKSHRSPADHAISPWFWFWSSHSHILLLLAARRGSLLLSRRGRTRPCFDGLGSSGCRCMDSTAAGQRWLNHSRQDHLLFSSLAGALRISIYSPSTSLAMVAHYHFLSLKTICLYVWCMHAARCLFG